MLRKNIFANVVGRAWGVISVYLFIPVYLKILGGEAYGLVGFYSTLVGVLTFADMGLTATLNRELARLSIRKDSAREQVDLVRTYEIAYIWISLGISVIVWLVAPAIARFWLKSHSISPQQITLLVRMMGITIALQLPSSLYIGGLMGLQRQVHSNCLQIGWGLLRGGGAVIVLWWFSPTVLAFFSWQLVSNVAYFLATRTTLWRVIALKNITPHFRRRIFETTWRYAMGMAGMSLLATILMETDKVAVSKLLTLETFGFYTLATALAGVPRTLASPIGSALFPKLTGLVEIGNQENLKSFYTKMTSLLGIVIIPGALCLALLSKDFIYAWTGNFAAAQQVGLAASGLILGEMMQALTILPYYLALAKGDVRLNLRISSAAVVVVTPLLIFLISKFGVTGAGASWVIMNLITLPPYMYYIHKLFMPGELFHWFRNGVLTPLLVALPCTLLGQLLLPHPDARILILARIGLIWTITMFVVSFANFESRQEILLQVRKFWRSGDGTI